MVAFRFLYLGLLIGTAFALPIYPRSEFDGVDKPSGDGSWTSVPTIVNLLFPGFMRLNAYFCIVRILNPRKHPRKAQDVNQRQTQLVLLISIRVVHPCLQQLQQLQHLVMNLWSL